MSSRADARTSRARKVLTSVVVMATFTTSVTASDALLGGGVSGLLDTVTDIVDPVVATVDHGLRPVTGLVSDLTGLPVDEAVSDLVTESVDGLLGTAETLVVPDNRPPLARPDFDDLAQLAPLEPADTLIEDVVYPGVIETTTPVTRPALGVAGIAIAPLEMPRRINTIMGWVRKKALAPADMDAASYVIRAETPDGEIYRDNVVDVPLPIDVNGDGADDITVEMRIVTAQPSLRVTRLPGAPATLPLAVEAIMAPDGHDRGNRLAFGYDALGSNAPGVFRATVTDLGTQSDELAVELHTVSPGSALTLTAAVFDWEWPHTRIAPTDVRVGFTPMPEDATVTAQGISGSVDQARVRVDVSEPSRIDAGVHTQAHSGDEMEVGVIIDRVPEWVDLAVSQVADQGVGLDYAASGPVADIGLWLSETEGGITRSATVGFEGVDATTANFVVSADDLSYTASAPIDALTVEVIDPRGIIDRATVLRARLEGLPEALAVTMVEGGAVGLDAGAGGLGLLELQLVSDPDVNIALAPGTDGLVLRDLTNLYSVFVRVTDLRSVTLTPEPQLAANLRTAGGRPFVASIAQATADGIDEIDARLSALPAEVDLALLDGPTGTTLSYTASAVVDLFEVDLRQGDLEAALRVEDLPTAVDVSLDEAGVSWVASDRVPLIAAEIRSATAAFGRATDVRVDLVDVPTTFSLALEDGTAILDAPDGIGVVEVTASDDDDAVALPAGDGLVFVDRPDRFEAALRLTGLRGLSFTDDPVALSLQTIGDRVFDLDVEQVSADGSGTDIRATIDRLPSSVSLALGELDGATTLDYEASATIDSLVASMADRRADGGETTVALEATGLADALTLVLGEDEVSYTASAVVPSLRIEVTDPDGLIDRADRLLVELLDLPRDFTLGLTGDTVSFDAGAGVLGSLEALVTSGPELGLPAGTDGLLLIDDPSDFVAAVRIVGLRGVTFDTSEQAGLTMRTVGGRLFEVDVRQATAGGDRTELRATLDRLPAEIGLALAGELDAGEIGLDWTASDVMDELRAEFLSESAGASPTTASVRITELPAGLSLRVLEGGTVTYAASSRVPVLELDLTSPDGIFAAATELRLRAADLPTGITASIDDAGGLSAQTTGGALGSLEALFSDGKQIGLDGSVDGIVYRDTANTYAAFVRLTGLHGITFAPADGGTELALDTDGGRVFVVDVLTEDAEAGTATAIEAALDPLPSSVSLTLADDEVDGLGLDYTASEVMDRLWAAIELTDVDGTTTFGLEVLDLATAVSFALDSVTGALHYTGSDRVTQLAVVGENPAGIFQSATRIQALLQDLPTELEIGLGGDAGAAVSLDAKGGRLGLLEVLATTGPELFPADGIDGVVLRDTATEFLLALRINDLHQLVVVPDPVAFTIGTDGGRTFVIDALVDGGEVIELGDGAIELQAAFEVLPTLVTLGFGVAGEQQALTIDASQVIDEVSFSLVQTPTGGAPLSAAIVITDVPSHLELAIDIQGAVTYSASATVPSLELDAEDPSGLFDRADKLSLRLVDLPRGLDVGLSDTGAVEIVATGGRLGQLEALAWLNDPTALAAGTDGVVLEDLTDDYRVFARFTGIDSVDVAQVPQPRVRLTGAGGRPISIGLYESAPGKASPIANVAFTTASLVNAPPVVDLAMLDGAAGTINIAYSATATANQLSFQTNSGDRWITSASIANPVPRSFVACQTGNAACAPGANRTDANIGSFSFIADQHTTLNVLDCSRPLNANCTASGGTQLTHVDNLRVKTFQFSGDIDQGTVQAAGWLYANTVAPGSPNTLSAADVMNGRIYNRDGDTRLTFNFGNGFKAQDRFRRFDRFPSIWPWTMRIRESRGSISCTSGTNMNVQVKFVFNLSFNATDLLC